MSGDAEARAHHQAGHAVAAVSFRFRLHSVGLDDEGDHDLLGHAIGHGTRHLGRGQAQRQPEIYLRRTIVALAGPEAEHAHMARAGQPGTASWEDWWRSREGARWSRDDLSRARTLLSWIHNPLSHEEALAYLTAARYRTRVLVGAWRPVLRTVAEALLDRGRLEEDELKALCWRGVAG